MHSTVKYSLRNLILYAPSCYRFLGIVTLIKNFLPSLIVPETLRAARFRDETQVMIGVTIHTVRKL